MSAPILLGGVVFELQSQPADLTRLRIALSDSAPHAAARILGEISNALKSAGYVVQKPKPHKPNFARMRCPLSREGDIEMVLVHEGGAGQIETFCLIAMAFVDKRDRRIRIKAEEQWHEILLVSEEAIIARYAVGSIRHLSAQETAGRSSLLVTE